MKILLLAFGDIIDETAFSFFSAFATTLLETSFFERGNAGCDSEAQEEERDNNWLTASSSFFNFPKDKQSKQQLTDMLISTVLLDYLAVYR